MKNFTLVAIRTLGRVTLPILAAIVVAACGQTPVTGMCDPATDPSCTPTDTTSTSVPLAVTQVQPADGATAVETGATVTISFNRTVAAASVTSSSVSVGSAAGDLAVSGTTVTFTPTGDLSEGTSYAVSVNGVTDEAGVGLASAFSSSFSTLSNPVAADVGPDFDASMGASVTLDKGASTGTGATFTWTQLSGPDVGALTGDSPTFTAPDEVAHLSFELSVSDGTTTETDVVNVWVLEDAEQAFWVSPSGDPANAGTREAPFSSIQDAIDVADNAGAGADVYIAAGTYDETLTLRSRVSLYGGFEDQDWTRDVSAQRPVVNGGSVAVQGLTANDLTIDGLEVVAANATGTGASSIAVVLNTSNGVVLSRNVITAGDATAGVSGSTPSRAQTGAGGSNGGAARGCTARISGGGRGVNYRDGGTGGLGAWTNATAGGKGEGTNGGNAGGVATSGNNGKDGGNGKANGSNGANGSAGSPFGTVDVDGNYVVDVSATAGGRAGHGYGGGGGGGAYGLPFSCGGSGGGGGGGGEAGYGSTPGTGGGASFAILVIGQGTVEVVDNTLTTGAGGRGGVGPTGGSGGWGGSGGSGGRKACDSIITSWCTGTGGDGGDGTTGGRGGHGGSAGGGPSIGIVEGSASTVTRSGNVFSLGAPGAGGDGPGNDGPTGETTDHKKLN